MISGLFGSASGGGIAGGLPTGVKLAAGAFLAHQLMKHGNSAAGTAGSPAGGGLSGMLGGLFGSGAPSSGMGGALGGLLGGGALGGLGGLLGNLRGQGLGREVDSWVSPGDNHPVAPAALEGAFDPQELDEAARHAGTDRGTLLNELSGMLPDMVHRMTPDGRVPQHESELGSGGLSGLLGGLLGGRGR